MFRATVCSSSGGQLYEYIWYNRCVLVAIQYTGRPLTQSDYTRSCINPLQTKRRLLYLKTQSVPRCKHFSSRL